MSQGEPGIELDISLGYMLKAAASALHSALEAVLRPLGMTITHYACLELLAQRPGLSNSELARGAFVTRQSMNVLLQALERQGLVVRPAQAPVGRALPTELTARGRRQLKVASAAVRRVEQDMLANLDTSEQDQMRRLLTACIGALTEPHPEHSGRRAPSAALKDSSRYDWRGTSSAATSPATLVISSPESSRITAPADHPSARR